MRKRLAIITHEYYPLLCGGTIFAEKLAVEFSRRGYDVEVICSAIGKRTQKTEQSNGFKVQRFYTGRFSTTTAKFYEHILFLVLGFPQFLFHLWRYRFTHILPIFAVPSGLIGMLISKILGIPNFVFIDGADTPGIESEQKHLMDHLVFVFKLVTKHSAGVIVLQGVEDLALPLIDNPMRVVIPNGTSIPDKMAVLTSKTDQPIRFLSIGRMVARKGFGYIVDAAYEVSKTRKDFCIDIIGYGQLEAELRKKIQNLGLEKIVVLRGSVPYDKLEAEYLATDCYIFYGGREGSSLAMVEALSYGLPIICTDEPGSRAFVEHKKNGVLVPWQNSHELANALTWVLDKRDSLSELGHLSRQIAEKYSWAEIARMYDEFFAKVISSGRS